MNVLTPPPLFQMLKKISEDRGFTMPSEEGVGSFLRTLAASKPGGNFLELGTGMGLSLSWMADGMHSGAKILSLDNDPDLTEIVSNCFTEDERVTILCCDGEQWLKDYDGPGFDLIFADTWPGKYNTLEKTLSLVNEGGFYVVDDMNPQENWPDGHDLKATALTQRLEELEEFHVTKMNWSTGIIIACRY